jgi:putative ABC transport system substrate-binding protein
MRRRAFIKVIAGSVAVIGFLDPTTPLVEGQRLGAFVQRLRELGWMEGRNVAIEVRWAEGRSERFTEIAGELVRLKVDVIVTYATSPVLAAKQAKSVIPIVFASAADPGANGLVASLAEPKQLQLLHEVAPTAKLVGFLGNPTNPGVESDTRVVQSAASTTGQEIVVVNASNDGEIDTAFDALTQQHAQALLIMADPFLNSRPDKIVGPCRQCTHGANFRWLGG